MTARSGTTATTLVQACRVSRAFDESSHTVHAVREVNCQIMSGDQIALTGPSGSGKSTLTHLLAGLDSPTSGYIEWPAIGSRYELRPGPVAVIFQAPSLLDPLDVTENVELPLLLDGVDRPAAQSRAKAALLALGLGDLFKKLPEELSGGQAQRVAVARALAGEPRLILADEPTGQLDRRNAEIVIRALTTAAERLGAGLLVNTHDPRIAEYLPLQWQMHDGVLSTAVSRV